MRALVAGATGFIGSALCERLVRDGVAVRALVRDAERTRGLAADQVELHEGDVLRPETLTGAGVDVDVAYYLVHRWAAARRPATSRPASCRPPRRSVVGAGSESYRTLRHLVARLPFMIAPRWLSTPTQPIDIDDVVAYLAAAPHVAASTGREVQIGSPDVLAYGAMLDRMAIALGKRPRPKLPVPLLTPWLSSLWIGLVTPVDVQVARPLIEGLSTETVVTDPSGAALFDVEPIAFDESLRKAVASERLAGPGTAKPHVTVSP
jgi:uncharacterized protein YbjT (DUF2867 family)